MRHNRRMTRLFLMMAALGLIIVVRFVSDQAAIRKLANESGLNRLQARTLFRAEIYNAMAANKLIALLFLGAIGYGIYLFLRLQQPDRILLPILTIIMVMEIGRYVTRNDAYNKINERLRKRETTEIQ